MPHIDAQHLRKFYESGRGRIAALNGVSLSAERGEFLAVTGPSGCGKSTLLHLIGGLDLPDSGELRVGNYVLSNMRDRQLALFRRSEVGVVFQFFNLFSSLTVLENILLPSLIRRDKPQESRRRAFALMERVGLGATQDQRANELSGGEMQRVALCRALLNRPGILLADEPTGNLDSANREKIYAILRELHRDERITVILVTHEPDIGHIAHRTLAMRDGRIV